MKKLLLLIFVISWVIPQPVEAQPKKEITFDKIFDGTFSPDGIRSVNWMQNGQYYTAIEQTDEDVELRKYDITSGDHEILVASSDLSVEGRSKPITIQDYQFSSDEQKLLIKTDIESIWRRSTKENYFIYDLKSDSTRKLTQSENKQQYAAFSPAGDKVAYVQNNNLFVVDLAAGKETQITNDGEKNKIINGSTDWVYEEEFGFAKAWYWSPDGQKIAYYKFDESRVKEFFYTEWGSLYPGQVEYKYPKAGEKNSIVKVGVYDLQSDETTWMDIGEKTDQYIPRINWTRNPDMLSIRRMNRLQNRQDLMLANANTGQSRTIKTERSETWIDVNDDLRFLESGQRFIYTSEEDGYNHIFLYDMEGKFIRQITDGNWEVTNFLGYDKASGKIYYTGTKESPLEQHFYSIGIDGNNEQKLSAKSGWYSVNMSPDFRYYIQTYSAPRTPPKYTLHKSGRGQVRVLEDNKPLQQTLNDYKMPTKEFISLSLSDVTLSGYMLKPADFDSTQKHGVIFYVYGGPGSQTVTKRFAAGQRAMWHRHLTAQGYIVVSVDNRGTGARGRDFEKQVYKKLGQLEIKDQMAAAQFLANKHSYIDATRMGIWGWSYGGYMAALGISKGHDIFKTAISVAPVTNWRFYDTIYTERFMQTPQMNPEGYKKGSPINYADKINGDYLLVHGTGDDNVHFQNSMEWVNALVANNVAFRSMYYPNRNHGIYGGNTRRHLYRMLNDFITEHL